MVPFFPNFQHTSNKKKMAQSFSTAFVGLQFKVFHFESFKHFKFDGELCIRRLTLHTKKKKTLLILSRTMQIKFAKNVKKAVTLFF